MTRTLLVFQHVPHEGLGHFEPVFRERGLGLEMIHSYERDLSGLRIREAECRGLVIMGGPMSANDEGTIPFVREELRLIGEALHEKLPILGVCLGSQMIAKVLGAKVYRGVQKEIGWYPLWKRPEAEPDPLLGAFPPHLEMFQWHGETFDLPRGARLLASSELYLNQAFSYEDRVYGLQFHAEITLPMIDEWLGEGEEEIRQAGLPKTSVEILADSKNKAEGLGKWAHEIAKGFAVLSKVAEPC